MASSGPEIRRYGAARRLTAVVTGLGTALGLAVAAGDPAHAEVDRIEVTNLQDSGPGSLRAALAEARATAADDHVTFAPSVVGTIQLTSGELSVVVGGEAGNLTVEGPGADALAVDADHRSRVLHIQGPGGDSRPTAVVSGLTLTNGFASYGQLEPSGGAMLATGTDVALERVLVASNEAGTGGGVAVQGGNLVVAASVITRNTAGQYGVGGGIHHDNDQVPGTRLVVRDSTISDNRAGDAGGGIAGDSVTLTGSTVTRNTAHDEQLWLGGGSTITGSGGGVAAQDLTVDDSYISENEAGRRGGGLAGSSLAIARSTIAGNVAGEEGGGIQARELRLQSSTVTGNRADRGGGIHLQGEMFAELRLSTVAGNTAPSGGGIHASTDVTLRSTVIAMNSGGDLAGEGRAVLDHSLVREPMGFAVEDAGGSVLGLDPLLGALADHGGPTQTLLPASNSPVIDRGSSSGVTSDQRDSPRPVDDPDSVDAVDGADVGAVELTPVELAGPTQVVNTVRPVITGRARVGETLHTDGGSWQPAEVMLSYQWLRNGDPIPGATGAAYTPTADDFGRENYGDEQRIAVVVTATAAGRRDGAAISDDTDRVRRGRLSTSRPARVKGKTRVGRVLRAKPRAGAVSPSPDRLHITWYLGDRRVRRARDDRRLELTRRMRGERVTVRFSYRAEKCKSLVQVVEKRRRVRR